MSGTFTAAVPEASTSRLFWIKAPVAWVSWSMGRITFRRITIRNSAKKPMVRAASRTARASRKARWVFTTSFMLMSAIT